MPTLYQGDSVRKPKLTVVEVLMYNMAALLAGVAAGYDVRMSNVSPVHPILQPPSMLNNTILNPIETEFIRNKNDRNFTNNTYHGPARHNRALLTSINLMPESMQYRFPDQQKPSIVSTTRGLSSNFITSATSLNSTPSIQRKTRTSVFTNSLEYSELQNPLTSDLATRFRPSFLPANNIQLHTNTVENEFAKKGHKSCDYFGSNYFPYQSEINIGFERDCKSYPDYNTYVHRYPHGTYYEENSYGTENTHTIEKVPHRNINVACRIPSNLSNNSNFNRAFSLENDDLQESYAFNNLNLSSRYQKPETFYEHDQNIYKDSCHLNNLACKINTNCEYENVPNVRTHRNSSFAPKWSINTVPKNENAQFRGKSFATASTTFKDFQDYSLFSLDYSFQRLDQSPQKANKNAINSSPSSIHQIERSPLSPKFKIYSTPSSQHDMSLLLLKQDQKTSGGQLEKDGFNSNKIKTSSKKYSATSIKHDCANSISIAGTPTNQTPDSLTSDDSSYLSARESSASSHSRVRFSTDAVRDIQLVQNEEFLLDEKFNKTTTVNGKKHDRFTGRHTSNLTS